MGTCHIRHVLQRVRTCTQVCGQLNAAVTALAEKAADLVAVDHSLSSALSRDLEAALSSAPEWASLYRLLVRSEAQPAEFAAGESAALSAERAAVAVSHESAAVARHEAARALISNHVAVVRDATNEAPRSQMTLKRLPRRDAKEVDAALREVARRLLMPAAQLGAHEVERRPSTADQAAVWVKTTQFLDARLGVPRDMSEAAALALRAALLEVKVAATQDAACEARGHQKLE